MNHPPVDAPTAIAEIKKALATYEALVAQEAAVITSLMDMDQSEQAKTRHHAFQKFIIGTEAAFKQVRMEFNHAISDHAMSRVRAQLNVQSDRESASPFENRYLQLNYLYRDADNYKKAGTALFLSHKGMKAEEANQAVAPHLIDETFFLAEVWGVEKLRIDDKETESDHDYMTFEGFQEFRSSRSEPVVGSIETLLHELQSEQQMHAQKKKHRSRTREDANELSF